ARNPPAMHPNHYLFYPPMVPREVPVGAVDIDDPPRYSSLEPQAKPAVPTVNSSTMTSPPRYSYWERTFGRQKSPSQVSTTSATATATASASRRETTMVTAKELETQIYKEN
uniref:Uncharacterized protein n=3 Tax=Caenorhabditis japonica TaxID=281687 RepID=A0A8R1I6G0_CAEJA